MKTLFYALTALLLLGFLPQNSYSTENPGALDGIHELKVYFDLNTGEPGKLLTRLQLIDTTYNQLVAEGISTHIVIGIRGKASNYFTQGTGYVIDTDLPVKEKAAAWIEHFNAQGFQLEQCRIAAGLQEIEVSDFLPRIKVVPNGYIAMIAYQAKGHSLVPMD